MGPDRRRPVKARARRAPINPSVSKGRTEAEPSCSSASSSRPDRRCNRAARLLQHSRLQQHRSLLGLEPVDHVAARQGMGRIWSTRAHIRPGRLFHVHNEDTRCATGVRGRGYPRFPVSEISRHSNCEPACAVRCTGRTPRSGSCNMSDRRLQESESRVPRASSVALAAAPEAGQCFLHVVLDVTLPDRIAFLFRRCCKRREVSTAAACHPSDRSRPRSRRAVR